MWPGKDRLSRACGVHGVCHEDSNVRTALFRQTNDQGTLILVAEVGLPKRRQRYICFFIISNLCKELCKENGIHCF